METRKDRMNYEYVPKLHDYVIWRNGKITHEGWIYYKGDEYISIELGVTDKPHCDITTHRHKKNHILLVCPNWEWHNLEYVTQREDFYDETPRNRTHNNIQDVCL